MRRDLERIQIPGEHDARVRTWETVSAAFREREPAPRRVPIRPLAFAAAALALGAAAFTPPGRAVVEDVREAIGTERAEPALFRLPTPGRVLVNAASGAWIVNADGSKRFLGPYRHASWSPRGLYVVATRAGERGSRTLVALDPRGELRWTLPRRAHVRFPRWAPSGVRIAYLEGGALRVVAGDGTGDRLLARRVSPVAPAWRPGRGHRLAYVDAARRLVYIDADSRRVLFRTAPLKRPERLEWASDGLRLLALHDGDVTSFTLAGAPWTGVRVENGRVTAVAAGPERRNAYAIVDRARSEVFTPWGSPRRLFSATGPFREVAWSPDGHWVLIAWPRADQWVFARASGKPGVRAVANVSVQFDSGTFPSIAGWCCR